MYTCVHSAQDVVGNTPLHFACQGAWSAIVRQLVLAGADPCLLNQQGANAFANAVGKGFYS